MTRTLTRGAIGAAHVLAVCDLSAAAMNAARRAALVSRDLQLPLRLLYRSESSTATLPAAVTSFADEAARQCGVEVVPVRVAGDPVSECVALARDGLLVLATRGGNPLAEWLMGTPAERLIRLARSPVLVVKQPATGAYRRVFVPVDLRASSDRLVAHGASLARESSITLFHALNPAEELFLHEMDAPPQALRAHRRERSASAHTRMEVLLDAVDATARGGDLPAPIVAFGSPAHAILAGESAARAELIVIGKRRRGLLADFLLGSVTRQVVAASESDVLIVPLPPEKVGGTLPSPHRSTVAT